MYLAQGHTAVTPVRRLDPLPRVTGQLVPKSARTHFWSTRTLVNLYLSQLKPKPTQTLVYLYLYWVVFKRMPKCVCFLVTRVMYIKSLHSHVLSIGRV